MLVFFGPWAFSGQGQGCCAGLLAGCQGRNAARPQTCRAAPAVYRERGSSARGARLCSHTKATSPSPTHEERPTAARPTLPHLAPAHPPAPACPQAKLHARQGQRDQAAHYHKLNLDRIDAEGISGQDAVEALTFLAEYHQVGEKVWFSL